MPPGPVATGLACRGCTVCQIQCMNLRGYRAHVLATVLSLRRMMAAANTFRVQGSSVLMTSVTTQHHKAFQGTCVAFRAVMQMGSSMRLRDAADIYPTLKSRNECNSQLSVSCLHFVNGRHSESRRPKIDYTNLITSNTSSLLLESVRITSCIADCFCVLSAETYN